MTALTAFDHDDSGKIDLTAIYDRADPRGYYQTLAALQYRIPEEAAPVFRAVFDALAKARQAETLHVADVGCSYGVNAAVLKLGLSMADLGRIYGRAQTAGLSRRDLVARDRALGKRANGRLSIVGIDVATRAVGYACQAGILDGGVVSDLETWDPTSGESLLLSATDIVISTGAIGYVGAPTFGRILDVADRPPWLAMFALRMFPIDEIAALLRALGYRVFRLEGRTFAQRRFADDTEAAEVLANLAALGVDPAGLEAEGWLHAEFFLALPTRETGELPLAGLVEFQGPRA